jgi:hypothetical protein
MPTVDYKRIARRREQFGATGEPSLPAEFWPDSEPVMVLPEPGSGQWPKKPVHTCATSGDTATVITIRENQTMAAPMNTPEWRSDERRPGCQACYYDRVKRQAEQVLFEINRLGELRYTELQDALQHLRFAANARQRRARHGIDAAYRAYPQEDGRVFVIAQVELLPAGQVVPTDRTRLFYLLHGWAQTPEDKRISSSGGWGGPWQGTRGDGRVSYAKQKGEEVGPAVQLWTSTHIIGVAKALDVEMSPHDKKFTVTRSATDVYEALTAAGVQMHERKTNRSGLDAFLETFVTDNSQANQNGSMRVIRDTLAAAPSEDAENGRLPSTSEPQLHPTGGESG